MSQRVMIIGVGESGKSGLARELIKRAGLPFYVFDPLMSRWDGAVYVTASMQDFIVRVESDRRPLVAMIDEAMEALSVGQRQNHVVFTRWRHRAIIPIASAQRYTMLAPNVRVNATDLYIFETAQKDCEALVEDYNCPEIMAATEFVAGEFLHVRKEGGQRVATAHKLFDADTKENA